MILGPRLGTELLEETLECGTGLLEAPQGVPKYTRHARIHAPTSRQEVDSTGVRPYHGPGPQDTCALGEQDNTMQCSAPLQVYSLGSIVFM